MATRADEDGITTQLTSRRVESELSHAHVQDRTDRNSIEQSLPPCDRGVEAWRLLASAFVVEALLWGFPLSFGVFQDYYSRLPQFAGNPYVSVIGTTASGICYMGAPVIIPFTQRFSRYRRWMVWIGWPLCIAGLIAGSFCETLGGLVATQGFMYGFGFVLFYYPITSMVNEFWIARRGMAYGILCSSSGASGAALPFAFDAMLNRYGYPTTLRVAAIGLVVLTGPLVLSVKGRLPESAAGASTTPRTDWSFLRQPIFWVYSVSNLAQGLGYFFPTVYLPSYATAIGLSSRQGALLLALASISQVLGQVSFGWLSDRRVVPLNVLLVLSSFIATITIFTFWGFAHTFHLLAVFAIVYGYFAPGFTAMWARMGMAVSSDLTAAFTSFGLFNFGKGVGNVLTGPISGALVVSKTADEQTYAAGKYRSLVLFAGTCMAVSTATISLCYLKPLRRRQAS